MLVAKEIFDCSWAFEQLQLHRITSIVSRFVKQLSRIRHEFSCSLNNECIAVLQTYRLYLWSAKVFQVELKTRTKILSHRWIKRQDIDRVTRQFGTVTMIHIRTQSFPSVDTVRENIIYAVYKAQTHRWLVWIIRVKPACLSWASFRYI